MLYFSVPLFHGLSLHARVLINCSCSHSAQLWSNLTGVPIPKNMLLSIVRRGKEVPLLLRDSSALLILILFSLPLNVERAYFSCVTQALYNLTLIQSISQLAFLVPYSPKADPDSQLRSISNMYAYLKSCFERNLNSSLDIYFGSSFFESLFSAESVNSENKVWTEEEIIKSVKIFCLPFMRLAALFQSHLYNETFPANATDDNDDTFSILNSFLELKNDGVPSWLSSEPLTLIDSWIADYCEFFKKSIISAKVLKKLFT